METRIAHRIFTSFLLALTLTFSTAQTASQQHSPPLTYDKPGTTGMSVERLSRIDSMCMAAIDEDVVPGIVALVARNGKIVYNKAFGTADAETDRALKTDDIFRLASQSKAITATAVMMLWERGKFQLDDPVYRYIPEFKDPMILDSVMQNGTVVSHPAENQITIRHLLTHTSGIGYGVIDGNEQMRNIYAEAGIIDLFTTEDISIGDNVKKLAALPLHHEPGEAFTYSESYDVLGYFIEVISGMPFDEFLQAHIFAPLGMTSTAFYLPDNNADRLVSVQTKTDGSWTNYPTTFYNPDYPITGARRFFSGGAGLCSTAEDYAKFLQMYLNKGEYNGQRLLSRTTVDVIMANHIGDLWGEDPDAFYGLAFMVQAQNGQDKGGAGSKGTFSWGGYFNTQYFADPQEQIIGILLKQTRDTGSDPTGWKFRLLVGQSIDD